MSHKIGVYVFHDAGFAASFCFNPSWAIITKCTQNFVVVKVHLIPIITFNGLAILKQVDIFV